MPMQWGPTKIGAMQYNGVTIGEAMYNGQIVWTSSIYPLTLTFTGQHDGDETIHEHTIEESGTYTLHIKALVTRYATHGTALRVNRNGSHLVTTPWAETDNVWTERSITVALNRGDVLRLHSPGYGGTFANGTFTITGIPSPYPLTGTYEIVNGTAMESHEVFSHTVVEPGNYTATITVESGRADVYAWFLNGVVESGGFTRTYHGLSVGDTIVVGVMTIGTLNISGTWSVTKEALPVVHITGTTIYGSRDQFRQACIDYGTTFQTVQVLPFRLDTSQATNMGHIFNGCTSLTSVPDMDPSQATTLAYMFYDCSSLTDVPDMDTSNVTDVRYMFYNCPALTDGNVRLIGKHPDVRTSGMIERSGLTREPWYNTNGNPI